MRWISNYAVHVQFASDVTCDAEAAMLERNKLARATISRLLRKCYFSRRSERRAPSIPRALKRNEKACIWILERLLYYLNYLNDGTGNPWAGQCKLNVLPAARMNELTRSSLENFGPFAPNGSGNVRIVPKHGPSFNWKTNYSDKFSRFRVALRWKFNEARWFSYNHPASAVSLMTDKLMAFDKRAQSRSSYLNAGTGWPCAWHCIANPTADLVCSHRFASPVTEGALLPTGSLRRK